MIDKNQIQTYKERLLVKKEDLEKQIKELSTTPEFGTDVDHFEEEADEAEEYSANLGLSKALKERLEDVRRALDKIESQNYGICEKCGGEIEREILEIDPESRLCKACKTNQ